MGALLEVDESVVIVAIIEDLGGSVRNMSDWVDDFINRLLLVDHFVQGSGTDCLGDPFVENN